MPDESSPDASRHVMFRVGQLLYALPLESVREVVVPRPPFVRVPRSAPAVQGAMNLRGRVVAVVDLAKLLGIPPDSPSLAHVVMLDRGRRALGFSVGPVLGVESLRPPASEVPASATELLRGTAISAQHRLPVTLLDPEILEARASALFAPV